MNELALQSAFVNRFEVFCFKTNQNDPDGSLNEKILFLVEILWNLRNVSTATF